MGTESLTKAQTRKPKPQRPAQGPVVNFLIGPHASNVSCKF